MTVTPDANRVRELTTIRSFEVHTPDHMWSYQVTVIGGVSKCSCRQSGDCPHQADVREYIGEDGPTPLPVVELCAAGELATVRLPLRGDVAA